MAILISEEKHVVTFKTIIKKNLDNQGYKGISFDTGNPEK